MHISWYLQRLGWQMFRLRDADRSGTIGARSQISFAYQAIDGHGMQLTNKVFANRRAFLNGFFDIHHRVFDVFHFTQVISRRTTIEFAFDVIGEGRMVTFDTGRTQAFQHMKDELKLKK